MLALLAKPPLTRPGTGYAYSNAGYVLAGLMAEEVSGQSWEELMQQRLFGPLKMASAGFGPPGKADSGRVDQPWGHRENHGRVEPTRQDNAPCMGPAGTVHCSVPDWGKFASLHLRGAQGKARLLKPATFRALHTPRPGASTRGAGTWSIDPGPAAVPSITAAATSTWYCTIWIAPARDFATLVATNQGGARGRDRLRAGHAGAHQVCRVPRARKSDQTIGGRRTLRLTGVVPDQSHPIPAFR